MNDPQSPKDAAQDDCFTQAPDEPGPSPDELAQDLFEVVVVRKRVQGDASAPIPWPEVSAEGQPRVAAHFPYQLDDESRRFPGATGRVIAGVVVFGMVALGAWLMFRREPPRDPVATSALNRPNSPPLPRPASTDSPTTAPPGGSTTSPTAGDRQTAEATSRGPSGDEVDPSGARVAPSTRRPPGERTPPGSRSPSPSVTAAPGVQGPPGAASPRAAVEAGATATPLSEGPPPEPVLPPAVELAPQAAPMAIPDSRPSAAIPGGAVTAVPRTSAAAPSDDQQVRIALNRYREAYESLNVDAVRAVWPGVDARALRRGFDQLTMQQFEFAACEVSIAGDTASANCSGNAQFAAKVGNRSPRVESRVWRFELRRSSGQWRIQTVDAR